jgi:hypothetical protein
VQLGSCANAAKAARQSDRLLEIEALHQAETLGATVFVIAQVDAGLLPPEEIGRQNREPVRGKLAGFGAHRLVDAKDLLQHDDSRSGA